MAIQSARTEQLDRAFSALADPTRRAILARLATGEATVSQLVEPFALSQPTISKHLKVLEDAGFIERGRDAQRRPRKLVLCLRLSKMLPMLDWSHSDANGRGRFNNLDDYLADQKKKEK